MRTIVLAAAALSLLAAAPAKKPAGPPKKYDVSTDAALTKSVKTATGTLLSKESLACVKRLEGDFAKVVVVGQFAHDRGCAVMGYFADGEWVGEKGTAAKALASAGWKDPNSREALALQWANEGMASSGMEPGTAAKLNGDGSVVVEGWRRLPIGMQPIRRSQKLELTFSIGGDVTTKVLEEKSEPIK
jgi:hypothetical protein